MRSFAIKKIVLTLAFLVCVGNVNAKEVENSNFKIDNSETITIDSKALGRKYDLYIKLPEGYSKEANKYKKYPVLYLNDGPHTFKVAAGVTHFPQMNKVIVVGISFAHGENGQYSRVRDLTPITDDSWRKYKTGGAPKYLKFFEDEVIPYIEENYRSNPTKRILSGHSLGGSFGAWVLLTKPELFSSYILTSPSLWYKKHWIFDLEDKYHIKNKSLNANLYFATGSLETIKNGMYYEMADDQVRFVRQLVSRNYRGLTIEDEIVKGTDHYSTFPVGLSKGLMFIYKQMKIL